MIDYNLEKRKFVIGGVAIGIVTLYVADYERRL